MFPLLDRNIPHVEDKILSYMEYKELATSMLVCKEWCQKARPFLYEWFATIQRKEEKVPLQMAVIGGYDHLVAFFLRDKEVDVNETSQTGRTALMEAAIFGKERITRMLLEREDIDINLKTSNGYCAALFSAAACGRAGVVKILLERPDILVNDRSIIFGHTALIEAVCHRGTSVIEELLKHPDIDVNIQDADGETALSLAKRNFQLRKETTEDFLNKKKIIKMLEEKNAM